MLSCRKEHPEPKPVPEPVKKVLLKDITIPSLPSPYYHFAYNADSTVAKASFADSFTNYEVSYANNRIAEMRNTTLGNHDTLRYVYDQTGKPTTINIFNRSNGMNRHVFFYYNVNQVKEIDWDKQDGKNGFVITRTLKFDYYPDGNVKTQSEHRPDLDGSPGANTTTLFEQYDDKINVDDFSLIHAGFSDHLILLQGFRIRKNNAGKETFTQDGDLNNNITTNTYTYNSDGTPSAKKQHLLFTAGPLVGRTFETSTGYTYY